MSKHHDTRMRQDIGQVDCKAGQSSSKLNIDLIPKVMKQTKLLSMYSQNVYTCSHCLISICGEHSYRKHVESCSAYKCSKCKKTFFSDVSFNKKPEGFTQSCGKVSLSKIAHLVSSQSLVRFC